MPASIDTVTFGCQLASTYLALDFWGSRNRNKMLICQCQGVSVGSGLFAIFRVFRKKFPRGSGDGFCDFVCFRTSKISGYFRELNKSGGEVYKSLGCFAALRRYPCLRVQSSYTSVFMLMVANKMTVGTRVRVRGGARFASMCGPMHPADQRVVPPTLRSLSFTIIKEILKSTIH